MNKLLFNTFRSRQLFVYKNNVRSFSYQFHRSKRFYAPINRRAIGLSLAAASVLVGSWNYFKDNDNILNESLNESVNITTYTVEEVQRHNSIDSCWIVIDGYIYDVTEFLRLHPGGASRILKVAGNDATNQFNQMHTVEVIQKMQAHVTCVGKLDGEFDEILSEEEIEIMENKLRKPALSDIFNISDFEYVAKKVLPKVTYFYYATGATDEYSLRENHYAYSRVFYRPKILQIRTTKIDTSTTFLGNEIDVPIYISGFAGSGLAHPDAEKNLQKAAYATKAMQMVPKLMSFKYEDFFATVPSDQNQWFQYHFEHVPEVKNIGNMIKKIELFPTIRGIFINVDCAAIGNREKDSKMRAEDVAGASGVGSIVSSHSEYPGNLVWDDIKKIRAMTKLPMGLKGVQRGEDVVMAAESGFNAVVLSNHGGRQLDFSRPPLEVLVEAKQMLKEKNLEDKIEIYLDGGIRRGSDIVKAICLGAKGVGLGRPFLFAMAGYGAEGATKVIELLKNEMKNNMTLLGANSIDELNEDMVDITNLKLRSPVVSDRQYDLVYEQMRFPKFKEF